MKLCHICEVSLTRATMSRHTVYRFQESRVPAQAIHPAVLGAGENAGRLGYRIAQVTSVDGIPITSWGRRVHRLPRASSRVATGRVQNGTNPAFQMMPSWALQRVAASVLASVLLPLNRRLHVITSIQVTIGEDLNELSYGYTRHHPGGNIEIFVNKSVNSCWRDFVDTILHELAHALHGDHPRDAACGDHAMSPGHCWEWARTFAYIIRLAREYESEDLRLMNPGWLRRHAVHLHASI